MEVEEATERNEAGESEEREESDANEQETDVSLVPLVAKPRTKSAVWNYFCIESDSDGQPNKLVETGLYQVSKTRISYPWKY